MEAKKYKLCLYIAGKTQKSNKAIENLRKYCEAELRDQFTVEIIDLLEHPHLAEGEQIIAVPTLIKKLPAPMRILVGDLSDKSKVLVGLNLVTSDSTR
ncbi:circadian clock KaiB family protein [Mucilaginibacter sp. SJ]|uniref:circadian clock KaiB family protein n=1 Tax=Mucilaginibacter sp. SJ TaxID=3029053 RepID=UPI0023A9F3CE|nr:circadian clock KaiB family protein [Mucilaginibacter sp. SJ]WEA01665.1 circadian clock KaiB family protein [Mucilaginibacter sp. SJ]